MQLALVLLVVVVVVMRRRTGDAAAAATAAPPLALNRSAAPNAGPPPPGGPSTRTQIEGAAGGLAFAGGCALIPGGAAFSPLCAAGGAYIVPKISQGGEWLGRQVISIFD